MFPVRRVRQKKGGAAYRKGVSRAVQAGDLTAVNKRVGVAGVRQAGFRLPASEKTPD
jgi:hypothetical protein